MIEREQFLAQQQFDRETRSAAENLEREREIINTREHTKRETFGAGAFGKRKDLDSRSF